MIVMNTSIGGVGGPESSEWGYNTEVGIGVGLHQGICNY